MYSAGETTTTRGHSACLFRVMTHSGRPNMLLDRRSFVRASAIAAGTALLAPASLARAAGRVRQPAKDAATAAAKPLLEWKELTKDAKGNTVWAVIGGGGNTLVLDYEGTQEVPRTEDRRGRGGSIDAPNDRSIFRAALVVDTKMTGYGRIIRRGIDSRGMRVASLINTHHHYDHTGGNDAFIGGDVSSVAHPKALARIIGNVDRYSNGATGALRDFEKINTDEARAAAADAKTLISKMAELSNDNIAALFSPQYSVDDAKSSYGKVTVTLTHVGAGHTDNDLLVFLPELDVLHTGDLLFNKVWPYIDRAGGCDTKGWITSLERAFNMCSKKTIVIPGHGDITDRDAITRQIAFFKDLRERAAKAVAAGTARDEFLKLDPPEYKDFAAADWIKPITLGGLWDEAKGVPIA